MAEFESQRKFSNQQVDASKCKIHSSQCLSLYCTSCEQVICTTCSIQFHCRHAIEGLDQAISKMKHDVQAKASAAKKNNTDLISAINQLDKTRKTLNGMFQRTNQRITEKAEKEIAKIRGTERKMKYEAEDVYTRRDNILETARAANRTKIDRVEQQLDNAKKFRAETDVFKILSHRKGLLDDLKTVTEEEAVTKPDSLSFMDFDEDQRSFGKLLLDGQHGQKRKGATTELSTWKCLTEIKTFGLENRELKYAHDIAVFPHGEIVVADITLNQVIKLLTVSEPKFPLLSYALQIPITNLRQVSIDTGNLLVILDGEKVKIIDTEEQIRNHQFTPTVEPNSVPTCIAVDTNGLIAVGYMRKEKLSLHKSDGSVIAVHPAPMIGEFLTVFNKRFIYTNHYRGKIICMDYLGVVKFSEDVPNNDEDNWQSPTGVCCQNNGTIYVALHSCNSTRFKIQKFDPNGKYLCCIAQGAGPIYGISLTANDSRLVAAAGESVKIFCRQ